MSIVYLVIDSASKRQGRLKSVVEIKEDTERKQSALILAEPKPLWIYFASKSIYISLLARLSRRGVDAM